MFVKNIPPFVDIILTYYDSSFNSFSRNIYFVLFEVTVYIEVIVPFNITLFPKDLISFISLFVRVIPESVIDEIRF